MSKTLLNRACMASDRPAFIVETTPNLVVASSSCDDAEGGHDDAMCDKPAASVSKTYPLSKLGAPIVESIEIKQNMLPHNDQAVASA